MNSLEIVNREIQFYEERIKEHKKYYKDYPDIFDRECYEFNVVCLNEFKQIKQDLEVLDFLKKNFNSSLINAIINKNIFK